MINRMTMGMCLAAMCSAAVMAQSGMDKSQMGDKDKMKMKADTVMVTGCVADKDSMGHYMLNHAMMSDHMMDKSMPSASTADMKSPADMKTMSYMLSGGDLKMHVGHKVEVTGMMEHAKKMKTDTMGSADHDKMMADTLKVKSVKMLAASCQ